MNIQDIMILHESNQSQQVPGHTLESLNRYVYDKIPPGSFLTAFLSNDLKNAFGHADDKNIANMYAIVKHCYNNIPMDSWGSPETVAAWLKVKNE